MTIDGTLSRLNELHLSHDGPIPATRRFSGAEAREILLAHETGRFRETARAIVARRGRLTAAEAPGDAWIRRLERAAAFHRDRALRAIRIDW